MTKREKYDMYKRCRTANAPEVIHKLRQLKLRGVTKMVTQGDFQHIIGMKRVGRGVKNFETFWVREHPQRIFDFWVGG